MNNGPQNSGITRFCVASRARNEESSVKTEVLNIKPPTARVYKLQSDNKGKN